MLRWLLVVGWIALILGLSSIPSLGTSRQLFAGVDKLVHMCEYGVLGFLFARARGAGASPRPLWLAALLFGLVVGTLDELYQARIPGRTSDVFDTLADVTGATLGAVVWWYQQRRRRASHDPRS